MLCYCDLGQDSLHLSLQILGLQYAEGERTAPSAILSCVNSYYLSKQLGQSAFGHVTYSNHILLHRVNARSKGKKKQKKK